MNVIEKKLKTQEAYKKSITKDTLGNNYLYSNNEYEFTCIVPVDWKLYNLGIYQNPKRWIID